MLFPEFSRKNIDGTAPTTSFLWGLYRRLTNFNRKKVFIIGFHKTGTTSLTKAMVRLGYRVCGSMYQIEEFDESCHSSNDLFDLAQPLIDQYDVFEDTPWFMLYRELLDHYPESKFILTIRPADQWYRSVSKHFGGYDQWKFHSWIYQGCGDPIGNKNLYIDTYNKHNKAVQKYFKENDKQLLIMNLPEDFNWDTLCGYLDCKIPWGEFPHANSASSRNTLQRKLLDGIKKIYYNN